MICKNCGAHFEDSLPKCPFCETFHYEGARKEYMNKLEDLKEDLEDLEQDVKEVYREELKTQTKQMGKIVGILLSVLCILTLFFFAVRQLQDLSYAKDEKAVLLFTKEAFPVADAFYENQDYDGLLAFYQTSLLENEHADFYNWEHYAFLICYENYQFFKNAAQKQDTGEFSAFDLQDLFYSYLSSRFYQKGYPMDAADQQLVSSFEDEMEAMIDSFELTDRELRTLNDFLNSTDYPSWEEIRQFSDQVYQRIYEEEQP